MKIKFHGWGGQEIPVGTGSKGGTGYGWFGLMESIVSTGGMGGIVLWVYEFEMYYGFYGFMCFLSQEEEQQQYTSLLLTGLLTGVSR